MQIMNANDKKKALKILELFGVIIAIIAIEIIYFGYNNWDMHVPVTYDGGDAFSSIANMKMRLNGDGYRMGWPFYEDVSKYSPKFTALSILAACFIDLFVDDFFVAQNIFLFLIPVLNVVVSYIVFTKLNIRRLLSFIGALIFGFSPYVQIRLFLHQDLAAVECIPIVFMFCFWLMEDEKFAAPSKAYFKHGRNIFLILFSWMIANNGIVYYPFFSCFILLVTGLSIAIQSRSIKKLIPSIVCIINIVFWLAVGFVPALYGALSGRGDVATNGTTRDAIRSTFYGLDIRSLLLSPKGYGIGFIKDFYEYLLEYDLEQYYAYLGIVGIVGFIVLLICLLVNKEKTTITENRIMMLSRINIMLILLGVSCGLGVIVALFVPFIASYNRVSIFILFACITAVLLLINNWLDILKDNKKKYFAVAIISAVMLLYGFYEQSGCYAYLNKEMLDNNTQQLEWDRTFFAELEQNAGENSMVYMLPYMSSFENGSAGNVSDYEHFRGYMNTETIRWSYGGLNGGLNDRWYEATSEYEPAELIEELKEKAFAGIYINVDGYDGDEGKILTNQILKELGTNQFVLHESGHKVFIPIN